MTTRNVLVLALAATLLSACGPGDGSGAGPGENEAQLADDGQCVDVCPTCTGADVMLAIGTPDHPLHKEDAERAKRAARKLGFTFKDVNGLTADPRDTAQAEIVLAAVKALPNELRTLVIAIHGHGVEDALIFLDGSTLSYERLFAAVEEKNACQVFISNDSCFSGSMFRAIDDDGLAKCGTFAASAVGASTESSCGNGLSAGFTNRVLEGTAPRTALEESANAPGVQNNVSAGEMRSYRNPECACESDCIERTRLGDGATAIEQPRTAPPADPLPNEEIPNEEIPNEEIPSEEVPSEEVPNEEVPNEEIPGETLIGCDPETFENTCDGDVARQCIEGDLSIIDCAVLNKTCELVGDVPLCVEREGACGDIPPAGVCYDADTILLCEGGDIFTLDCDAGQRCEMNDIGATCTDA